MRSEVLTATRLIVLAVIDNGNYRKKPLGRPRCRWECGIRMDLYGDWLGGCGLDSTGSEQGPVAGCCECGDEPSGSCTTELVS
jgi:hypothetical protein